MYLRALIPGLGLCLALQLPAAAQDPAGPDPAPATEAGAPPPAAPKIEKDPASGVEVRGLMWRLAQTMKGRPVMAVGYGTFRSDIPWSDEDFARAATDVEKLQIISAKNSAPDNALIPFQIGRMYVVAPETREEVNPNLGHLTAPDIAGRGLLLADLLARLTPEQQKALGTDNGLAVTALPPDLQASVARAFRPPLHILTYRQTVSTGDNGLPQVSYENDILARLEEPLDASAMRLRARLRMGGVMIGGDQSGYIPAGFGSRPVLQVDDASGDADGTPEAFIDVPNTFKPSDLTGAAFPQPLGLTGVWSVQQVVEKLAKVTGHTLSAWEPYRDLPVFLGSESLRAGDVLDGLRLSLPAAWRKMGSAWYLAWDRKPLGAVAQAASEAAAAATDGMEKRRSELRTSMDLYRLVDTLPFAEDDPLALSDEQRARLFGASPPGTKMQDAYKPIKFDDMTPEQRQFVRAQAPHTIVGTRNDRGEQTNARTASEEDITRASLMGSARVEVSVNVPGHGWVGFGGYQGELNINRWMVEMARRRTDPDAEAAILEEVPEEIRAMFKDPKPVTPPSALRGLVVPTLAPGRLTELADEMKRHGLNVLFYPALYGGYATFPGTAFPLDPALRGADGLAAAVTAMKPKDIRVVAYVSTLAWQNEDDPVHWLNKHPDWLDVDVLGRSRLAWVKDHPDAHDNLFSGITRDARNYVRATEPAVEARLKALVTEVAARSGVSAIAFAAWQPAGRAPFMSGGDIPPDLGYAWPDRLAAFQKTGMDPADVVEDASFLPESVRNLPGTNSPDNGKVAAARIELVSRLIDSARAARKDWRVYLINDNAMRTDWFRSDGTAPAGPPAPKPDLTIASVFASGPSELGKNAVLLPVPAKTMAALIPKDDAGLGLMARVLGGLSPIVMFDMAFRTDGPAAGLKLPMALYDFRQAPGIITDSLQWIKAP